MRLPSSPVFVALIIVAALFAAPGASVDPESLPLLSIMQAHLDAIQSTFGFLSPPGVSRALSMHTEAVWNAVMPYTETLLPTLELEVDRRPVAEHTQANRATAATMAAYCVAKDLFVNHQSHLAELEDVFAASGLSASDAETEDSHTPVGIGNRACRKVLEYRHKDGMNQLGDEMNSNGPYSDYTLYYPVNDPQPTLVRTNCSQLRSIDRWQPLRVPTPDGREVTRQFLAPYMARVTPFALSTASEFRPGPPAMYAAGGAAREQFIEQHTAVLNYSATLDDYQKVVAEFFADGPDSTLPPGHSMSVAMELARERNLGFVDTVKSMFVVAQAIMDAGIASWEAKRYYDSVRPIVAIQCLFQNQMVKAWAGPYQGVQMIDGGGWQPYQESHFKTPPFAELPSGHSSFSGSMAGVLRRFYGTDEYGGEYTIKAGESLFEPAVLDPSDPRYVAGETDVPNQGPETKGYVPATDITLRWETLTDFANDAGISRLYGGIHIRDGDMFGRTLGAQVAEKVWNKYRTLLVDGSAGATTGTTAGSASSSSSSSSSDDTVDTTEVLTYALIGSFVGSAVVAMLFGAIIVWFVRDMNTTRQSKERKFQTSTTRDLRANEDVDDDDVVKEEMELPAV